MQRATAGGRRFRRAAGRKWPPAAVGATLIVGSAIAFALDGPVARVAYQKGLDPATFGFWRASAGVLVLGGWLATRLRLFLAGLRRIGATQTAVLSLCEPLTATLLAAVMLRQLPAPTQLLGAALLVGAGIAVQIVAARSSTVRTTT